MVGCLVMHCAAASISMVASWCRRSIQLTSASSSHRACFCLPNIDGGARTLNPKN
jgi:hypothetical protein